MTFWFLSRTNPQSFRVGGGLGPRFHVGRVPHLPRASMGSSGRLTRCAASPRRSSGEGWRGGRRQPMMCLPPEPMPLLERGGNLRPKGRGGCPHGNIRRCRRRLGGQADWSADAGRTRVAARKSGTFSMNRPPRPQMSIPCASANPYRLEAPRSLGGAAGPPACAAWRAAERGRPCA